MLNAELFIANKGNSSVSYVTQGIQKVAQFRLTSVNNAILAVPFVKSPVIRKLRVFWTPSSFSKALISFFYVQLFNGTPFFHSNFDQSVAMILRVVHIKVKIFHSCLEMR